MANNNIILESIYRLETISLNFSFARPLFRRTQLPMVVV